MEDARNQFRGDDGSLSRLHPDLVYAAYDAALDKVFGDA